jgi:hypothetical protein
MFELNLREFLVTSGRLVKKFIKILDKRTFE